MKTDSYLLDTCAFIWLINGDKRMKKSSTKLEKAAKAHRLFICPITSWEIFVKASQGKIMMSIPVFDWVMTAKRKSGIQSTILSDDVMYHSTALTGNFHKDPADRMIVATALVGALTLVTGDGKILDWAKNQNLKTVAV